MDHGREVNAEQSGWLCPTAFCIQPCNSHNGNSHSCTEEVARLLVPSISVGGWVGGGEGTLYKGHKKNVE